MKGGQNTAFQSKTSINCRGKLIDLSTPKVMGILNVTPDSFYDGGKLINEQVLIGQAQTHLEDGATFLDLGAVSTRPKAAHVTEEEEQQRLIPALKLLRKELPEAIISVDTFRSTIASTAVDEGADMINDISGGTMDEHMFETMANLQVPYVLMHIQGTPDAMQENPIYEDVVKEVFTHLMHRVTELQQLGLHDLIIDPGFGFGKTVEHNYSLLQNLEQFTQLGHPLLVGFSRKSMINRVLGTKPEEALNGTTVLNTIALMNGASTLRVHDVKEAVEAVRLVEAALS